MVYEYTKPRAPVAATFGGPGPCYGMPGLIGQRDHDPRSVHYKSPAYPFGIKRNKFSDDCSPGPAYSLQPNILRNGKDMPPAYTLAGRNRESTFLNVPGPGAYAPEQGGHSSKPRPPAFSFGLKGNHRQTDNTPGPNAYTTDPMLFRTIRSGKRQAPRYTMCGKSTIGSFCQDLAKTPGPGAYNTPLTDKYKMRSPGYYLTGRNLIPGDATRKPGPGDHAPEKHLRAFRRSAPAYSFGIRHSQYEAPLICEPVS